MSEFLENLSPKDKVIFLGGGALVIFFLAKTITGAKAPAQPSTTPTQADAAVTTANNASTAEQAFEETVTDQINAMSKAQNDAQAATTQALADMQTGLQSNLGNAIAGVNTSIASSIAAQNTALANVQSLLNQMGRTPVYNPPPASPVATPIGQATPLHSPLIPGVGVVSTNYVVTPSMQAGLAAASAAASAANSGGNITTSRR